MAANTVAKIIALLKQAGIDYSKMAGTIDPNVVTKLYTKTEKTATKPKLIDALNKDKATYQQALDIFENDAKYLSQMNEMEQVNFANNLQDYFKVGGPIKYRPSNVVTPEGTPVEGKKLETLAKRKGAKEKPEATSLRGAVEGLGTLIDEIKGISPKIRNQMDRDELVKFIRKMRGRDFTNQEIKWVRDYMDEFSIGLAKEKAGGMQIGKKLGAKDKEEFEFVNEYLDDIQTTSPKDYRKRYGNVESINMKLFDVIDKKLEKHFKKKYKWDDTKKDGGLDDATFEKYEDELYDTQKEFGDFHRVYDTFGNMDIWGRRKGTSWVNNPKNYLDEASEKLQSITGEGLNTNFWKNYTDEVLTKYPKPEKFQYGGIAGMLGEPTYVDDNHRVPLKNGLQVLPADFDELDHDELMHIIKLLQAGEIPEFADGGRIGFSAGGIDKMRRLFLQATGAGAAGIGAAKTGLFGLFKGSKSAAVKDLTSVPIENAKGMPPWFKGLVNRVIKEGTETTKLAPNKGGAYLNRQIVHSAKLGEGQGVRVTQDLDNKTITVEYQSADNMGGVDEGWARGYDDGIVRLEYKAAEDVEPMLAQHMDPKNPKGPWLPNKAQKTEPTFSASEAYPVQDPKDYKYITFEGDNTVNEVKDLHSDISALKQFGTNKTLSKKELAIAKQKRERVKKINENPHEELAGTEYVPDYDDYASGGRVPFKVGGKGKVLEGLAKLMDEFFPGTTKVGKTSKPYPGKVQEKMDLRKTIAEFHEREKVAKIRETIKADEKTLAKLTKEHNKKYGPGREGGDEPMSDALYKQMVEDHKKTVAIENRILENRIKINDPPTKDDYQYYSEQLDNPDVDYYSVKGNETLAELEAMVKKADADDIAEKKYWKKIFDAEDAAKKEAAANKKSPWFKNPKTLTPEEELRREFPGISDDLIKNILADDNPQRIAEVKATLKEALKMQQKGMGPDEIINIFKKQGKKPTKHATGGLAGMLGE